MILSIKKYGDPILRMHSAIVSNIDHHIQQLAQNMLDTMKFHRGVGLAANQIGSCIRLFIIDLHMCKTHFHSFLIVDTHNSWPKKEEPLVLINPIVLAYGENKIWMEGCLSIPGYIKYVSRPSNVRVQAMNINNEPIRFSSNGYLARVVQHEHDHINGILIVDR